MDETGRKRAERYLTMATENATRAMRCVDPTEMETYMHLASVWLRLAQEASQQWMPEPRPRALGDGAEAPSLRTIQ